MDKKIIWIDDRVDDMEQVVEGMFRELWKLGISNKTIFFGDAIREVDDKLLEAYQTRVGDVLSKLYDGHKGPVDKMDSAERELYEHLKAVYNKDFKGKDPHLLADRIPLGKGKIRTAVAAWKKGINREDWINGKDMPKQYSLDAIWKCINPKITGAVALDVILLSGDESKLKCEKEIASPVISMEFYHHITQKLQLRCILYSRYTYLNRLQDNWIELYKARYGELRGKPKIYSRRSLYNGEISEDVRDILLNYAQTEGRSDGG